ncbi:hypothetical protein [Phormidium sp. CCY1219]|uniref:hypothetical protein n=1 Tax=Phormidium sp. CCY1219 TaxID=2886104 RepID=UPI002D1E8F96|nr:hypothetical protein [Phormidium sp. CCY1219]MEB3830833.1 hypothetical protein [Phormidium sp. CCY1219]
MALTLQILHAADQEGGIEALEDAPRFSSVLNALRSQFPDRTLTLTSGDLYIPGPFLAASSDDSLGDILGREGPGRGDIVINNALGFQAATFGNHEFDLGTSTVASLLETDGDYPGTAFPYLSANLDLSTDSNLAEFVVPDGGPPQPNSIAKSAVIEVQGQPIGIVGATTPLLDSISSPGNVGVSPADPNNFDALAATIQPSVDALSARGINKIILLSHMQQISVEQELAPRLRDVDVIIAGGSNTLLADATDRLRVGDAVEGPYPILQTSASGEPVAIINTDGNYKYVGRLVADFDENGVLIPGSIDPNVSGAYATDETGVIQTGNVPADPKVVEVIGGLQGVIATKDGNTFGRSEVFLNGDRGDTRTQETNLGNLTADANLFAARQVDPSVAIAIKNGGASVPRWGPSVPPAALTPQWGKKHHREQIRLPARKLGKCPNSILKMPCDSTTS